MKSFIILYLFGILCISGVQALGKIKVDPEDGWFLDDTGRVRLFHGVNAVQKSPPWYWQNFLDPAYLDDLQAWGINVVRLGAMWTGVQPTEGYNNLTYVETLRQIVHDLEARDIYTLLDMHQDCLVQGYDGVPQWVLQDFPVDYDPYPAPLEQIDMWEECYITEKVSMQFQGIYNDTDSAVTHWAQYWGFMAQQFVNEDAVIGYELMNEPWVGDFFSQNNLLAPGVAGLQNLQPNYDIINDEIRKYDQNTPIFYEPIVYGTLFNSTLLGTGFTHVPGGRNYKNVSVLSYHVYCFTDSFEPDAEFCEETMFPDIFATIEEDRKRTGGGLMLTEFGVCKNRPTDDLIDCDVVMNFADQHLQSWIDWDYSDGWWYGSDGNPNTFTVHTHVRTYAKAVAGIPTRMFFDPVTNLFELDYITDPSISLPTEIYVPTALRYQTGFEVQVSVPELSYQVDLDRVLVDYTGQISEAVTVTVTPIP